MKIQLVVLFFVVFLAACADKVQGAPTAGEAIHVDAFEWRIVDQQQMRELHAINDIALDAHQVPKGLAGRKDGRAIIYTLPPGRVDDETALTLGHEVMHIALGKYHD